MKVLVTGNLGYSGVGITQALLARGCQVVGFDRVPPGELPELPGLEQVKGDLTRVESILSALEGCQAIVHAAIGGRVLEDDLREYSLLDKKFDFTNLLPFQVNVAGTFNLFEAARQIGIHQIVNISSAAVVFHHIVDPHDGSIHPYRLTAESPLNYRGYYGMNKHLQEQIGDFFAREGGMSVITLRPWWIVDGLENKNRYGVDLTLDIHPLTPAGLICRYDLGELIYLALQRPDIRSDIFYTVTGPGSDRFFDTVHLEGVLGWKPRCDFHELATTWKGRQGQP